jgi:hypothetical protein
VRYCIDRKIAPVTSDTFFKNLPKTGLSLSAAKLGPEGNRVASFKGLWLRDPENWGMEADPDERPVTDQATFDLALRREKGGQTGQGGRQPTSHVQPVDPVQGPPPKVQLDGSDWELALQTLRLVRSPWTWNYCIEALELVFKDRTRAEGYADLFKKEGVISEGPEGYWQLTKGGPSE